jgi:hypothetical protein
MSSKQPGQRGPHSVHAAAFLQKNASKNGTLYVLIRFLEIYRRLSMRSTLFALLALSVACASLTACKPHERTFGEKVRDTVDPPKGPLEKAGRAVDRATDN